MIQFIIECIIGMGGVIILLWIGIFIGREFGNFEKFVLYFLKKLEKQLKDNK